MRSTRPHQGLGIPLATSLVALLLAACDGGGEPSPTGTPTVTLTPTTTLTPTPAGFLPTPTRTPLPEGVRFGPVGPCPPLPAAACAEPGDRVNVYRGLPLERAAALSVVQGGVVWWVLDPRLVQQVLRQLDREVVLAPYAIPETGQNQMGLNIHWREGQGLLLGDCCLDQLVFIVDGGAGLMGHRDAQVQWPLPAGFVDLLLASLSDVTPTPRPRATPTPTIVPPRAIFFDHPEGELRWDGPDDRVYSVGEQHCGPPEDLKRGFGIPNLIAIEDEVGFWAVGALRRQVDWRWTGYYYGDWQIWQGDDGSTVYLVHTRERRIAFEYRAFGCQ